MPNLKGDDRAMGDVLTQSKIIAVVGHIEGQLCRWVPLRKII